MPALTCTAIIVAAGSSRRMGMDKLLWELDGMPVLLRTIHAFLKSRSISSIIVVCPQERWNRLNTTCFAKPVTRVDGGADRQHSVDNGLAAVPADCPLVAVHDGARPLVSPDDIEHCIAAAREHRAASLARRATETIKRSTDDAFTKESISRENLWFMETPQAFDTAVLRDACAKVAADGLTVTDEVSSVETLGVPTKLVESRHPNLKITTPSDLGLATALLSRPPSS